MIGVEMIARLTAGIWLVGGGYILFKRLRSPTPSNIGVLLAWLLGVVILVTYAEQHDDPWEQYVANAFMTFGSAAGGFLAALMVVRERMHSLNQRLDDHCSADTRLFGQFEKRILERLDAMNGKIDNLVSRKMGGI